MYKALQEQIQPRMLAILLVSLIVLSVLASFLYIIKEPFKNLRLQQETLTLLQREVQTGVPLQNQILMQQQLVDKLTTTLHGTGPKLAVNKMVAYIIGELDIIAGQHQVHLSSVKPQNPEHLFTFKELPFQVEISGNYFNLFAWLKDVEKNLGPIVIKQFTLSPYGKGKQIRMNLNIVAYQFEDKK